MTMSELEQRLSNLEKQVERLTAGRHNGSTPKVHPVKVLEKIHGTFANDEAFQEATRLGRAWRKAQDEKDSKRRGRSGR